ncbi:MAG: quinol:electron acceptor oxidoreductase subunit ActD [Chitinophagales bacterium]|nr:DUF3341 domain-containing protein [Chitinophagales bacterium]
MANDKYIVGLFDHEDKLVDAVRNFRKKHIEITDTLTPFPVHGLEHELGYRDTRLHVTGFMFGITGTFIALAVMTWISVSNYPLNIGGKPYWPLPSFIPITFELTVLCAAVGMVCVYCIRNGLNPFSKPRIYDERITDDRFALVFDYDEHKGNVSEIVSILKNSGAVEVSAKEFYDDTADFDVETKSIDSYLGSAPKPKATKKVEEVVVEKKQLTEEEITHKKNLLLSKVGVVDAGQKDDLKIIKGIGPVYEGRLNELGIYRFEQIANLDHEAKEAVEDLTGFPGRVDREDWIGQAKKLIK